MAVAESCPDAQQLQQLMLGRLADAAATALEQHIQTCRRCCERLRTLPADDALVAAVRARANLALHPTEQDVVDGLMGRLRQIRPDVTHDTTTSNRTRGEVDPMSNTPPSFDFLSPALTPEELGRLGPYRVLKVLGQGGMGVVFQAEDPRLERTVALKVMLPAVAEKATARERFVREAKATAAIEHDHIVAIYVVDEDRGVPYLAMPLLKGMSLESFLKKAEQTNKPPTLGQILKVSREIAKGLAAAHERGLIHRDIKPANVWLDATAGGRVKILDFGLARPAEGDSSLTQSGMIVGTPAYMAPEQAQGRPIDGRADLFSLGVVLYRLYTGRLPWHGDNAMATLMAVATEEAPPVEELNPTMPAPLAELVTRLLAKKPSDRPASAKAVVEALQTIERALAAATREAIQTAPAVPVEPSRLQESFEQNETVPPTLAVKPPRQRPRRWPLGAAAVVFLLAGGVALWQVVIRIKTQDGEVEVKAPTGATVEAGSASTGVPDKVDDAWIAAVRKLPAEKQVETVAEKLMKLNPGFNGQVFPKFHDKKVEELKLSTDAVADLSPVRALPHLLHLECRGSMVGGEPRGKVASLAPLEGMGLRLLYCSGNPISDLAPLKGMRLFQLSISRTQVRDLKPLEGMPLQMLDLGMDGEALDLSPLAKAPLKELYLSLRAEDHLDVLKSLPLQRINFKPAAEFLNNAATAYAPLELWIKDTQKLSAEKQVEAVVKKLKELNPGFDGKYKSKIEEGVVADLSFSAWDVSTIAPVKALRGLKSLSCPGDLLRERGPLTDLTPLRGLPLTTLRCPYNHISDLSPLRGMALTTLDCGYNEIASLDPIRDMPLMDLRCAGGRFRDLVVLANMRLTYFNCNKTPVADLFPLRGMPLTGVGFENCPVADLSPLKGMQLSYLNCRGSKIDDLGMLKDMPLRELVCDHNAERHFALLAAIPTLGKINEQPKNEFLKTSGGFEQWLVDARKLPPEKQVEAVVKKLQELNLGFDGKWLEEPKIEGGVVTRLSFLTDDVTDVSPLRALPGLKALICKGSLADKGKVFDLSPLKDMKLTHLDCRCTLVSDLSPLRNLKLEHLNCANTTVSDLTPLRGMPLTRLLCFHTKVADLAPLKDMKLTVLEFADTKVSDLTPIKGMPLTLLYCGGTQVGDLAPLQGMPLRDLACHDAKIADLSPLEGMKLEELRFTPRNITKGMNVVRRMPSLKIIRTGWEDKDQWPAEEFWKKYDAKYFTPTEAAFEQWVKDTQALPPDKQLAAFVKKLQERNPKFDGKITDQRWDGVVREVQFLTDHVTDISPVRALKDLRQLVCNGTALGKGKLVDLSPVRGMNLTLLYVHWNRGVKDLDPVRGMKLKELNIGGTGVVDLAPVAGMPLERLYAGWGSVDLTTLRDVRLKQLNGDFSPNVFRPFWSLETINDHPALEYWRKEDPKHAALLEWSAGIKKLPPEKQVEAVVQKLRERNPGFDGQATHNLSEKGEVNELNFSTDAVSDLWPVRALPHLRRLECRGTVGPAGQPHGKVTDLAALEGMKLYVLACSGNPIRDLTPLKNTTINALVIANTAVADLKPLEGLPLVMLDGAMIDGRRVFDLTPLQKAPLQEVWLVYRPERHAEILKGIPTLKQINGKSAQEVLKASSPAE